MNEAETRAYYIDPALRKAGWGVVEGTRIRMEFPISKGRLIGNGQRSMPDKADYVLQYKNRNLAVIEAKSDQKGHTAGVSQAKDYAERLQARFAYSTNGLQIYCIDMLTGEEKVVDSYPSPDELWDMTFDKDDVVPVEEVKWREILHSVPFEDRGGTWEPRYYIENAISKTLDAISKGQKRILLTLATGTGKTAIAFHVSWKLFESRWNLNLDGKRIPRILFLADRNILADQAFNSFSSFEEDALVRIKPSEIRKKGSVPKNGSIFFTIFQSFMSGPNDEPFFGEYPKDFFDFIIIDECHRGGASDESNWRAIMEYFSPAFQLGLTATPKRNQNVDTYRYFGKPVYTYSLKEGIDDGFLSPYKVKRINTTIDEYVYSPDDQIVQGEIDKDRQYTESEMNRVIEIKSREEYRVKLFLKLMNQNEKTLVFCATQLHALAVRDLINQNADSTNVNYCHRVTADEGKLGELHLRDFQDNEKIIPTILTTSQKLSTGVDAPEIRNIVLMRPVNSMIEFKQIIGRGTRLFSGKDYFTIYDFVGAHQHFMDPDWDGYALTCDDCGNDICTCEGPVHRVCSECEMSPCICKKPIERCLICGRAPCECNGGKRPKMIKVELSDGKVRELDSMVKTLFYGPDGKPISSQDFLQNMFGETPSFFESEDELRAIWSKPDTRKKLLQELSEKGFTRSQLEDFKSVIHAEDSDLYDLLSYVAFRTNPLKRTERADNAQSQFGVYESKQRVFLDFVLKQYIESGVDELDDAKLPELLTLKYKAISDAKNELGDISSIRDTFLGFQKHLYQED